MFYRVSDPRITSEEDNRFHPRVEPEGMLILETLPKLLHLVNHVAMKLRDIRVF
jgi:hypothetical protein